MQHILNLSKKEHWIAPRLNDTTRYILKSMDYYGCGYVPHVEACQNWKENDKISLGEETKNTFVAAAAAAATAATTTTTTTLMNNSKADTLNLQAISLLRYGTP